MIVVVAIITVIIGIALPAVSQLWKERKVSDTINSIKGALTGARAAALRLCRVLKTDVRAVPWVGLYARDGEAFPSEAAFVAALADGFCLVGTEVDHLVRFASALAAGTHPRPRPWPAARTPRWKRVLDRLGGPGR